MNCLVLYGAMASVTLYYEKNNKCDGFYLNIPQSGCGTTSDKATRIAVPTTLNGEFDGYYLNGTKFINAAGNIISTPRDLSNAGISLEEISNVTPKYTCNDGYDESNGTCAPHSNGGATGNRFLSIYCNDGTPNPDWTPISPGVPTQIPSHTICTNYANNSNYRFDGWSWKNTLFQDGQSVTFNESDFSLVNPDSPTTAGFITLRAQWTGASNLASAGSRSDCEYLGGHWCGQAYGGWSPATETTYACYDTASAANLCCYGSPQNCTYWQCNNMGYYWNTPETAQAANFEYKLCQTENTNRIELKSGRQYFGSALLYAWAAAETAFSGHRDASNPNSNFIYVDTDPYCVADSRCFPTRRTKLSKIQTRYLGTDIHGGYEFGGYYTGENCTGTKCIDKDGNILPVACSGTVYECWHELDNEEPAEGVTKLYFGSCDAVPRCWEFQDVPENDPRYHGTWYGPLYTIDGTTLYTDKNATQVAEYRPKNSGSYLTWYYRLAGVGYTDHKLPTSPGNSFTGFRFGENHNRLLLFPGPTSYPQNVTLSRDCGTGELYAGCASYGLEPRQIYKDIYTTLTYSAHEENHSTYGCFCHKNTKLPCGWRTQTGNVITGTGQKVGPWTTSQTLTAVYECN